MSRPALAAAALHGNPTHNPGKSRAQMQLDESLFGPAQRMLDTRHLDQRITLAQDRATRFAEIILGQTVLSGKAEQLESIAKTAALLSLMLEQQEAVARGGT